MIIPVLDLMIGQIVLAQGGNRDAYRPVQSKLTTSSDPVEVAQAMFNQTGCDWMYLADIDSFAGASPNWPVFNQLLERGFGLWVDADWLSDDRFHLIEDRVETTERLKVIVSSETVQSLAQFSALESLQGNGFQVIFSVDQKGDAVITRSGELSTATPLELVQRACEFGVNEFIILDLGEVGTRNGFQSESAASTLIEEIRSERRDLTLTSGGGVRNADDVRRWIDCGCDHVLVASAIHDCALTPDDASQFVT
ncbi:MAG: HisA/HisF-related TIM barrel protein [Planctomycetota bacterium]